MSKWEYRGDGIFRLCLYNFGNIKVEVDYNIHTNELSSVFVTGSKDRYATQAFLSGVNFNLDRTELITTQDKVEMRKQLFQEQLCAVLSDEAAPTRSASDELDKIKDNPKAVGGSAIRRIYNRVKDFLLFS